MEQNVTQRAIEYTRNRSWLFAIGSFVFIIAGGYLIYNAENLVHNGGSVGANVAIGAFMVLFFGYGLFMNLKRLINKTPAYIFTDKGLVYNVKNQDSGTVLWKEIKTFSRVKVKGNYFILLMIKNPEEIIEREMGRMRKRLMKMNMQTYKTPLSIAMNELQISVADFEELLKKHLKKSPNG
ncbi:STM3941 family protein [Saccharicrinis sp. FJH2]|uniref:STM3941 family protein n=1 Tax=Saccharicrinis sp. FJH65 TaxID=3344659 RepID=UPI0035F2A0B3